MSDAAIQIDHLSKQYRLGDIGTRRLIDDVNRWWARVRGKDDPLSKVGPGAKPRLTRSAHGDDIFYALNDISFDIKRGEVMGVIGRNGAGKSTLLKILSRVTAPSSGEVRIKGRIASLLEVGTGFHPELSGRDNIFLNGAILGMTKADIRRHFDEIVAFSEVEQFLDTPVKRYSSGMYVRLAFAVAAHLESEILVVDEVLAVGDAAFREKCLGKMKQVSRADGRTVIFVSHDMASVDSICRRGVVLEAGAVAFDGATQEAVNYYMRPRTPESVVDELEDRTREGIGGARIVGLRFEDDAGNMSTHFRMGDPLNLAVRVHFQNEIQSPVFGVNIVTDSGVMVADCRSAHSGFQIGKVGGLVEYRMRIPKLMLYPRSYIVEPWVSRADGRTDLDWVRNAASFVVISSSSFLGGENVNSNHGIAHIPTEWKAREMQKDEPQAFSTRKS